jgi:hypothetical protein
MDTPMRPNPIGAYRLRIQNILDALGDDEPTRWWKIKNAHQRRRRTARAVRASLTTCSATPCRSRACRYSCEPATPRRIAAEEALAEEAIAVGRRRGARFLELSPLLTQARAFQEIRALEGVREIEAALAEADAWLAMSGAKSYEPFLHVERPELARLSGDEAAREPSSARRIGS